MAVITDIGELNEKSLHAALKAHYARPGDEVEVELDGYVIDIVWDGLLLEIQTGNFAAINTKLHHLVQDHPLRLIYPIACEKWILKLPQENGGEIVRRKSPKKGRVEEVFREVVRIPHLLIHPHFSLEIAFIQEEEVRRYAGPHRWRRRGWEIVERRLVDVVGTRLFKTPADWAALLPDTLPDPFTTQELADVLGINRRLAQQMAYCLRKADIIQLCGKRGKSNDYQRAKHKD